MLIHYVQAVQEAIETLSAWATNSATLLAIGLGVASIVGAILLALGREGAWTRADLWLRGAHNTLGWLSVAALAVIAWSGLGAAHRVVQIDMVWRENAMAVADPLPSGAPIVQYGPALAALGQRTYTRTLRLPRPFLEQLGEEGVGAIAPYLSEPEAPNVLELRDRFRRSGRDVVFTRETTLREEEPLSFADSVVKVGFVPLGGRVYDAVFEGRYQWTNTGEEERDVRFVFSLPDAATVRDLRVTVDGKSVPQSPEATSYEWSGVMKPGDKGEAQIAYRAIGARAWSYNLGSQRRRVEQFQLAASGIADTRFARGSLLPTSKNGSDLSWRLANVVTAQQIAVVLPEDLSNRLYLQALRALPLALVLLLLGVGALAIHRGFVLPPTHVLGAVAVFAVGLGAATVVTIYSGPLIGLLASPLLGALAATAFLGRRFAAVTFPIALVPATFLSAQHTGLMILGLFTLALIAAWPSGKSKLPY